MSISIPSRQVRSITRLTYPVSFNKSQRTAFDLFQRRNYADEAAATQSEPVADGAMEAQHGQNSIADSADPDADANAATLAEKAEESEAASSVGSVTEKVTEQASATAESARSAAETASQTVTGATQSLAYAAGMESEKPADELRKESNIVYVGNLFFDVRAEDLRQEFERAGRVLDAKLIMDSRGLSKGFVYPLLPFPMHAS